MKFERFCRECDRIFKDGTPSNGEYPTTEDEWKKFIEMQKQLSILSLRSEGATKREARVNAETLFGERNGRVLIEACIKGRNPDVL